MTSALVDLEPWRKLMSAMTDENGRWQIFSSAIEQFASLVGRGIGRIDAVDRLNSLAEQYALDVDHAQMLIGDAFRNVEESERVPDEIKPNGKDKVAGFSKREFVKMFTPPDFLIDGILQRRFVYALTGQTGHAKSAVALLVAELVSSPDRNAALGTHRIAKGKVLYFVGENPDDICMRIIGADSKRNRESDPLDDQIFFVPGYMDLAKKFEPIADYATSVGGVDLVLVDTSAAYFLSEDENSNKQMGDHARSLRKLTTLPGGPCVLVLCHPVKYAIESSQLLPRGGGSFLAEMDGNLTLWKHDDVLVDLHYTKMRGPGFEPMTFKLETIWPPELKDAQGRQLPTVRAVPIAAADEQQQADKLRDDEDRVLVALMFKPFASMAVIAEHLQWLNDKGEPLKGKVQRALGRLEKVKPLLIKKGRDGSELTDEGKKVAAKAHAAAERAKENTAQEGLRF